MNMDGTNVANPMDRHENADAMFVKIESIEKQLFSLVDTLSHLLDPTNIICGSLPKFFAEYQSTLDNIITQLDDPEFQSDRHRVDIPPADSFSLLEKQKEIESNNIKHIQS